MKRKTFFGGILLGFLVSTSITIGTQYFSTEQGTNSSTPETIESKQQAYFANNPGREFPVAKELDFTFAAEKSTPTVVHITTFQESRSAAYSQSDQMDEMLRRFFGDEYSQRRRPQGNAEGLQRAGSGSGVILTDDGYIATNNHVIENADKIEVVLNDKRRYEAELIGRDPTTDLALLKISEKKLPFIKYGNSDDLKIGTWVLAVGNPFDLTSTVTAGIISAKGRNINILRSKENLAIESFIQTDAVVNPGNSGGALVDLHGNLIGINTAIATPTGTFAGYSFAVPVTLVKKVINDLMMYGEVQRALLGVSITDVTADLAEEKELSGIKGVYIAAVGKGSAAEEAGLEEGDIILKIDNEPVNSSSTLQELVARNRPGDQITVTIKRDDEIITREVTLKNKLGNTEIVTQEMEAEVTVGGARLRAASKDLLSSLDLKDGVEVIDLETGIFAEKGVKPGFIITNVDNKAVSDAGDVYEILNRSEKAVLIEGVYPNGRKMYYAIGL